MQLSFRLLEDVQNVNSMDAATEVSVASGDPQSVYLQLVDYGRLRSDPESPSVRYVPAVGALLSVIFENLDVAKKVTKVAAQPFATDGSIWKVDLTSQDTAKLAGTVSMSFTLTEGTRVVTGRRMAALMVK